MRNPSKRLLMIEEFDEFKKSRGLPRVYIGMRIQVDSRMGVIVGCNYSDNLDVVFEGNTFSDNVHPFWETVYYDGGGNIVEDFRK